MKKRHHNVTAQRPEYYARFEKMLADELAKPVEGRVGKLKTLKTGDIDPVVLQQIKSRYNLV
jgi:putative component of toxin-antitoxin plasmid stabilization module